MICEWLTPMTETILGEGGAAELGRLRQPLAIGAGLEEEAGLIGF